MVTIVILPLEMFAIAMGESSGIASGEVEVYTFTCPFNTGAVSHLIIQFPTLFSSHTTDIAGDVPEHDGSTNKTVSQLNRFLYIVSLP